MRDETIPRRVPHPSSLLVPGLFRERELLLIVPAEFFGLGNVSLMHGAVVEAESLAQRERRSTSQDRARHRADIWDQLHALAHRLPGHHAQTERAGQFQE